MQKMHAVQFLKISLFLVATFARHHRKIPGKLIVVEIAAKKWKQRPNHTHARAHREKINETDEGSEEMKQSKASAEMKKRLTGTEASGELEVMNPSIG